MDAGTALIHSDAAFFGKIEEIGTPFLKTLREFEYDGVKVNVNENLAGSLQTGTSVDLDINVIRGPINPEAAPIVGESYIFLVKKEQTGAAYNVLKMIPEQAYEDGTDNLIDPGGREVTDIIVKNICRIAKAPNISAHIIFHTYFSNPGSGTVSTDHTFPAKIFLSGILDDEDQHTRVLSVARTYCSNIIDSTVIKKP